MRKYLDWENAKVSDITKIYLENQEKYREALGKFLDMQNHDEKSDDFHSPERRAARQKLYDEYTRYEDNMRCALDNLNKIRLFNSDHIYMNRLSYTDINPYEVVEMRTPTKFIIREMVAVETELSRKARIESFIPCGFCGHTDNEVQDWVIKSQEHPDPDMDIAVRKHGDGFWYDTHGNRYRLSSVPEKFYDFNF